MTTGTAPPPPDPGRPRPGTNWVLIGFLAVAAFFLLAEHRAHLLGWLPYLLLLACPLMHLFHGHGGHGSHRDGGGDGPSDKPASGDGRHTHRSRSDSGKG